MYILASELLRLAVENGVLVWLLVSALLPLVLLLGLALWALLLRVSYSHAAV